MKVHNSEETGIVISLLAYFGDHQGNPNAFRIYHQPENSTSIFWNDVGIPMWLLNAETGRQMLIPRRIELVYA